MSASPRDSAVFELRDALGQGGCPVCRLALRSVSRAIQSIAYEQVNDIALRRLPAVAVAPFAYLIPVSALAISHVWLQEPLTLPVVLGALLVLAGVALSQATQLRLLLRARRPATMKI